jgi:hypothetical protein
MATIKENEAYERGIVVGWEKCMSEMESFVKEKKSQLAKFRKEHPQKHPDGCIDLRIVPFSMVVNKDLLDAVNKKILKDYGSEYLINVNHHVLIVDMGEQK